METDIRDPFCRNCGSSNAPSARFCQSCGTALGGDAASIASAEGAPSDSRKQFVFLALAVAVGIAIAGIGFAVLSSGALAAKHTITGTVDLVDTSSDPSISTFGSTCDGDGGYSDIQEGMNVTVKDETGKILGAGSLGAGTPTGASRCHFTFTIPNVPDAAIYSIEAGRRGALSYPRGDLEARGWVVALSIGD